MNSLQIPIPTDILYKFIAISGMALIFITVFYTIKVKIYLTKNKEEIFEFFGNK